MAANYPTSAPKSILVISLSQHLSGVPIDTVIKVDWAKPKAHAISPFFSNIGFNLNPEDSSGSLSALEHELERKAWDGVILGWCIRGHVEFTVLFEEVVTLCCEVKRERPELKLMFSTGQDNLLETVVRNFPEVDRL